MQKLNLGVAREIITPPLGAQLFGYNDSTFATSVHDDLTATAFYFEYGNEKSLLITATVCSINTDLNDEIFDLIEKETGVSKNKCILAATHTHSGPNVCGMIGWGAIDRPYCDGIFIPKILLAVKRAIASVQPVTISVTSGKSEVGINRRELCDDNGVCLGQNPWGPFNPEMTIMSFMGNDGLVANLIHYGAHGTSAGNNTEITRDWSGVMTDEIEKISGAITAFINGPEGDVGPRLTNGKTVGDITHVEELGSRAGIDAKRIYATLPPYENATMSAKQHTVSIPLLPKIPLAEAKLGVEKYAGSTVNKEAQSLNYYVSVVRAYENGEDDLPSFDYVQTAITVGPVTIVSTPFEPFSEIGMRIARAVDSTKVLMLSNSNGCENYMATEDQICRGGYEITMFETKNAQRYVRNADFHIYRQTVDFFKENK